MQLASRLRELRQARGLTQGQLAGDDFTKAFISQLETGRSKLSLRAAQVLASRLGVPVTELIEVGDRSDKQHQITLMQAERELVSGSPQVALKLAREVKDAGPLRGRVLRLQGRALLALDRAAEAIVVLERALEAFRFEQQREFSVRTLYDLAVAHARLDRPQQALVLALECERAAQAGDLVDRTFELQVETFLAAAYGRLGDRGAAEAHVEHALRITQDVVDHEALSALYGRLAIVEYERGGYERAVELWQQSLRELERLGRERLVADGWHNLATAYLRLGQMAKAEDALRRAERLQVETKHERLGAWIKLTRAKIALRRDRLAEADRLAAEASRDERASAHARAEALLVRAQVLDRKRAPLDHVRQAFQEAVEALRDEPAGNRVRALRLWAEALAKRGDLREAYAKAIEALAVVRPVP